MATRVIDDVKLQNIAVAIQTKDNGGQMTVDEMPGRIEAIPTGSPTVLNPALVLWDWEGTKLAEYSAEDVLALTELPAPSTLPAYATADHELLLFQEWNWSLANIKTWVQNHEGETLDVGAIYTTTDGQDHNYWGNPRLNGATNINMKKMGSTGNIPNNAFNGFNKLSAISFPNGVINIGSQIFWGCVLKMINIPSTVAQISYSAFVENYALKQINFPNNGNLGLGMFQKCYSLEKVNIPNGTTNIGLRFFYECRSLKNIIIPSSVIAIGKESFCNCYNLPKIEIPDSVTDIGDSAFTNCGSLCDILLKGKPTLSNTNAFSGLPTNYRIYVPRSDLSWFETATNWSTIYTQGHIVAIEDNIAYLESIGFNVDAYKGA